MSMRRTESDPVDRTLIIDPDDPEGGESPRQDPPRRRAPDVEPPRKGSRDPMRVYDYRNFLGRWSAPL
jgi:hypothetical protein